MLVIGFVSMDWNFSRNLLEKVISLQIRLIDVDNVGRLIQQSFMVINGKFVGLVIMLTTSNKDKIGD